MLRGVVLALVLMLTLAALAGVAVAPETWPMLCLAGLLVLGTLFERFHYRGAADRDGGTWSATAERFRDEESGQLVTVWFNAATGERRYVEAGETPPSS